MEFFVKKGEVVSERSENGKLYKILLRTDTMHVAISELEINAKTEKYSHNGEEIHFILSGEIEYFVGDKVYRMSEGDTLAHASNLQHWARNVGNKKAIYLTVGTPPFKF